MKKKIEKALGTFKMNNETWSDVLKRVNRERGIDTKTLYLTLGALLDYLEEESKT